MAEQIILLDTSVLIDYYRKKDKAKSYLFKLSQQNYAFAASVITKYEIYVGAEQSQISFWDDFFSNIAIFSFDSTVSERAITIYKKLKKANKLIDIPDLFIAATAVTHNIVCATLNRKHFERITDLDLLEL